MLTLDAEVFLRWNPDSLRCTVARARRTVYQPYSEDLTLRITQAVQALVVGISGPVYEPSAISVISAILTIQVTGGRTARSRIMYRYVKLTGV